MDKNENLHDYLQKNGINSATLAVIAGIITTLGDALSTLAAIMALEESQQSSNTRHPTNLVNIQELERQVQYLTRELHKLKRSKRG